MRKNFGKKNWIMPQPVLIVTSFDIDGTPNAMNAAWGGMYDEYKAIICLSTDHKTTENINASREFVLNFPSSEYVNEADYFGIISGHEIKNKFEKTPRLSISKGENVNAPIINEFPLALECKVLSMKEVDEGTTIIIAEIVNASVDKNILDFNGKIDSDKLDFICYDSINHKYRKIANEIADAFVCGLNIK